MSYFFLSKRSFNCYIKHLEGKESFNFWYGKLKKMWMSAGRCLIHILIKKEICFN